MGEQVVRGVVMGGTGGFWRVHLVVYDEEVMAPLRGRTKRGEMKLAVGDEVLVEREIGTEPWTIVKILPRRSALVRRAPGGAQGTRVIAANIDQVIIVFAMADPEPHPRMLDRFLVIAELNDIPARIVLNKIDLVSGDFRERFADDYERAGYSIHRTSVLTGEGLEALRATLAGRVSALTGPSGVGKSSLLNAMYPALDLRVGEISASVRKGRHTTVGASMHALPGGGFVMDTPGLREVGLSGDWNVAELDRCFPEFRAYRQTCRFADCAHRAEPGCAVRDAVERGDVSAARYDSYVRLYDELASHRAW
jgi:ribosome biogenesis GTPase